MKIVVVVGMPASGKNIARMFAQDNGVPYFATGDIVRLEVKNRGLEADAANTARVSDELRGEDGLGVTRRALATALSQDSDVVFIEGMRSMPEIELIRKGAPAVVVAFLAPRVLRRERVMSRGRADDSADAFEDRDMREISYGTALPIALADEYIINTGTMEDAIGQLETIIRRHTGHS
ncbi:MAG TPA: AAA family ATPase [Deltaproteobacteria bacterium]|nr:AAA family ATPase [Deltaproteobacteria bacterium]